MGTSIVNQLEAAGINAGWADRDGAAIEGQRASAGALTAFQGAQVVLADSRAGALVLFVNGMGLLRTGLPFARFDVLAFAGTTITAPKGGSQEPAALVAQLEEALAPACDGAVLRGVEGEPLIAAVVHELQAAEARHKMKVAR
jgi:cyanophycin synthetase